MRCHTGKQQLLMSARKLCLHDATDLIRSERPLSAGNVSLCSGCPANNDKSHTVFAGVLGFNHRPGRQVYNVVGRGSKAKVFCGI